MNMVPRYARGGIGDLLLCLQSAIEVGNISVFSHYKKAPSIFQRFGVTIDRFEYFKLIQDYNQLFVPGEELERHTHPIFEMPAPIFQKPKEKVIGIHIEGSSCSNEFWKQYGAPTKNMPIEFFIGLMKATFSKFPDVFLYVFCAPEREYEISAILRNEYIANATVIAFDDIWDSLACVQQCDFVVAMDSCVKTMSAILRIPTVVLAGNYKDSCRDQMFFDPYVKEGIMNVLFFQDLNAVNPNMVVEYITL